MMRIAISATDSNLEAEVDPRFGRCKCFLIVDPETLQFEALENTSAAASGGAGISAAQMIAGQEVKAVLTGNCGPNAYQVLEAAGIQVITGMSGNVRQAVESYKSGQTEPSSQANVVSHFGSSMGSSYGTAWAGGGGRGVGMGGREVRMGAGRMGRRGGMMSGAGRRVGPGGNCICPACGAKVTHQPGVPCTTLSCPKCGTRMVRE